MSESSYMPRLIDKKVNTYLEAFGAIHINGPKWSGKTRTAEEHSESSFRVGDPAGNFNNRLLAQTSPDLVLEGETPRLIDEWQEVPPLWDAVRMKVDDRNMNGQFILTGSSTPPKVATLHSGAGRIARLRMHTMSLFESGHSTGDISLNDLFTRKNISCLTGEVSLETLIERIICGGWPQSVNMNFQAARLIPAEYINAVISNDLQRVDDKKRDPHKMTLLLRSLARNESTTATQKKLASDITEHDASSVNAETVADYLNVFDKLFLLENQKPFSTKIRSKMRIKQAEKRHFCDPSIACAILGATKESLLKDMETLGFLFESLCERDLAVYAELYDGKLYHYQDYANNEIDAVIEMPDGSWGAFEIKLGAHLIDDAAENLLRIDSLIKEEKTGPSPDFLCIISGMSNAAYRRKDGVYVVPITALRN